MSESQAVAARAEEALLGLWFWTVEDVRYSAGDQLPGGLRAIYAPNPKSAIRTLLG